MLTPISTPSMSLHPKVIFLAFVLLLTATSSYGQCGCKYTINPGAGFTYFNGIASGVQPGDVICIQAGSKGGIQFTDVRGSATNPVIIKNCGGQALIGGPTINNAILFLGSQYVRLTGTGDVGTEYGIKVIGTAPGSQALAIVALSSDFEVDHLEIQNAGYNGMMIKSDPSTNCANVTAVRPNFTMRNMKIHNNYVHDTGGEGIYLGVSFYNGTTLYCGSTQYNHEVRGVRIYDNRFENNGREAIQVGSGVADVEVYNNKVYNYGQANLSAQNGGIQFGLGTVGRLYNNFIKGGKGPAIAIQGIGNDYVYNNVIVSPGEQAITLNTRPTPLATDIVNQGFIGGVYIVNNTFINVGVKGVIEEFINNAPGNRMFNNLIVASASPWDKTYFYTDWQKGNNIVIPLLADAKFTNPSLDDYSLQPGSPAINAGRDVNSFGVTFDYNNVPRPSGGAWDAGAFELSGNQKPVVTVGSNQTLTLPTNSTTITGSATDVDGTISTYLWTKQSGPAATLTNSSTTTVSLTGLVEGVYVFRLTATDNGGETGFKDVTITVVDPAVNQPPVANAGGPKTLTLPTNSTTLNGSASDTDGTITTYAWIKVSGPAATLTNTSSAVLSLSGLVQGVYVFRLTATDDDGDFDSDDATVTVNAAAVNQLPTANSGGNKTLQLPTNSTTLSGSGTDPDGTITTYLWTKQSGPAATLTNANTPTLQLTGLVVGTYVFRLTVTDNNSATAFAQATVTVSAANQAPTANAGGNKTIQLPTNSTTLTGSGSDVDGSITTYAWIKVSGPAATLTNAASAVLSLSGLVQGTYIFRLTVTDNNSASGSNDMTLTVQAANAAPTANAGPTRTITLPTNSTTLNGSGSDVDGTIATYFWEKVSGPAATLTGANTATLSLANLVVGSYVFRLTVTDNNGATGTSQTTVTVLPLATNQSPVADAGPDFGLTLPTNNTEIFGSATDPDGTIASYLWTKESGPAVTLSGTTLATLTLTNLVAGTYRFRLTATDNLGATASDDVVLTVSSVNQPPTVVASDDEIIILPTSSTTLIAVASDPDGSISNYLWINLSGPSAPTLISATTSVVSVSGLVAGVYVFRVTVTDNNGATAFDQVNVIVQTSSNINPIANAGNDVSIFLPTNSVTLTGSGTDADGTIDSFAWTQVDGAAATLTNANTNVLSVSGLTAGTYTFRLTVTDNGGATGISDVNVTVNLASTNQPPIANAGPNIALTLPNNSTNLIGSGSDADGTISTYNWIKLSGPSATLSNENTAVLSLQDLVTGVYVFRITVTDNGGAFASDNVQVTVFPSSVNQSPTVTAGNDITVTLPTNTANITATATDPDGSIATYSWTKQIGPTVTVTGENTNTLQLSDLVVGTYTFRINVTDNSGSTSFDETNITVLPLGSNVPPVVNAGNDKILFLPTNSINLIGLASDNDGSVTGYAWAKISGPTATLANQNTPNLSISNLEAGQYTFRLTATDNLGATAFDEATVTVFPGTVNQAPIANAGNNQTLVLPTTSTSLAGSGFDTDGSIVSYSWTQLLGPSTTLTNINSPTLLVDGLALGVFQFQLTVTDDLGATGSGIAQVTVVALGSNQPPIAGAGFDQIINLPQNSTDIQGTGIDLDGTIASYSWVKKSGPAAGTLSGETTSKLSLAGLIAGTYQFTLTVTDNGGLTNSDDVKVTVLQANVNNNPIVNAGLDVFIRQPASTTTLTAVASDIDGSITSYLWVKVSGPTVTIGSTNSSTLILTNLVLGTYVFRIEVTDNNGATASDEVTVTLSPPGVNVVPVVLAGSDKIISLPATSTTLNGSASDPDGSIKAITWTLQNGPNTPVLTGSNTTTLQVQNLTNGIYTFRLTATDNENATAFDETTVEVKASHTPPTVFAGNDTTIVQPDNFLSLKGSATATDGFIIDYLWEQTAGPTTTISGAYPNTSLTDLLTGVYTFRLTVTDNFGATSSDDLVVSVVESKSNPVGAALILSPNDDSVNDFWYVKNLVMVDGCPLKIFNNLGKQVFESTQYQNDWNGTSNGQQLREGDYYFVFECESKKTYSGALRLIR
jgi:gliding motility-associated-like protein